MSIATEESDLTLASELASLLNRHSAENASNTADFILAEFLRASLRALDDAIKARDKWYGIAPAPGWSLEGADPYAFAVVTLDRRYGTRLCEFFEDREKAEANATAEAEEPGCVSQIVPLYARD